MEIKIVCTSLSEKDRAEERWGLSFLVGESLLFDTFGRPDVLLENIKAGNIDIGKIKHIVISHDHWDHISGLWEFLKLNNNVRVYVCSHTSRETKLRIKGSGAEAVDVKEACSITGNIFTTGEIKCAYKGGPLYEQAVILAAGGNISIITGCAHPGIVNMIDNVRSRYKSPVDLVMGGFHLKNQSEEEARKIALLIRDMGIRRIAPTHCTGEEASRVFREVFGRDFISLNEHSICVC
ncbi:MAG: MBL fold metallo-hydrolase [Candidatus Omnitrophota bacterium]